MSGFYEKSKEEIEKIKKDTELLKKLKDIKKKKLIDHYTKENIKWEEMKKREQALIDYNRKPYMNESDWRHNAIWDLCIQSQMRLQENHYKALDNLRNAKLEDLI